MYPISNSKLVIIICPCTCRELDRYINRHFLIMGSNFRIAFFGSTCNFKIQAIRGARDIGNFKLQFSIWHTTFAQVLFLYLEFSMTIPCIAAECNFLKIFVIKLNAIVWLVFRSTPFQTLPFTDTKNRNHRKIPKI